MRNTIRKKDLLCCELAMPVSVFTRHPIVNGITMSGITVPRKSVTEDDKCSVGVYTRLGSAAAECGKRTVSIAEKLLADAQKTCESLVIAEIKSEVPAAGVLYDYIPVRLFFRKENNAVSDICDSMRTIKAMLRCCEQDDMYTDVRRFGSESILCFGFPVPLADAASADTCTVRGRVRISGEWAESLPASFFLNNFSFPAKRAQDGGLPEIPGGDADNTLRLMYAFRDLAENSAVGKFCGTEIRFQWEEPGIIAILPANQGKQTDSKVYWVLSEKAASFLGCFFSANGYGFRADPVPIWAEHPYSF